MNIFQKHSIKKQIIENTASANDTFARINHYLAPANNILWCTKLNLDKNSEDLNNFNLFKKNVYFIMSEIHFLESLHEINMKLCLDYPKLEEFSKHYFISRLHSLIVSVNGNIDEVKRLENYKNDRELQNLAKTLKLIVTRANETLENIKKTELEEHID